MLVLQFLDPVLQDLFGVTAEWKKLVVKLFPNLPFKWLQLTAVQTAEAGFRCRCEVRPLDNVSYVDLAAVYCDVVSGLPTAVCVAMNISTASNASSASGI